MNLHRTELQMRWLMIFRVVTITTLLISAFAIEILLSPSESLKPLFVLAAVAYGLVLLYGVLDRWLGGTTSFAYMQLFGDAMIVTGFVGITGGLDSPMSFLYLLPVCVGSLIFYRTGGLALAGACWALYAALVTMSVGRTPVMVMFRGVTEAEPRRIIYFLLGHLVAFICAALLSAYLAERLRVQGDELIERRGAVARLQALNENIIESINSGLATTDPSGRINFMNRGGAEITGFSMPDVVGMSIEELFRLEPGFLLEIRKKLLANQRFRFEIYFNTREARKIYLGIAASNLYDRTGRPLGFIFIFQDLTEIQAMEQEIRLKERMAALGEMAAGMAHELRNPLASISGAVQYLKGDMKPEGEMLELMDIILRESNRLDLAIKDFLTFARPGPFEPRNTDLVKMMQENARLLSKSREYLPGHRIEFRCESEELRADIDVNRIKQVFWNLATNALKAMPDGGVLAIETGYTEERDGVEICFSDQGKGMDEAEIEKYFQPFQGRFQDGTGLGAAIVYRLIEEHGGKIFLDSVPGEGTRVRVVLPDRGMENPGTWTIPEETVAEGARS